MIRSRLITLGLLGAIVGAWTMALAQPASVKEDPLVRMPGSQPPPEGTVTLEGPNRCFNCHAGFDVAVEPGFNWQGSMMAHAARDFLFYACMTAAAQDSAWAIGRPNATDICLRCHFPKGWVEGRSDPPNASVMSGDDFDGVQCDYCHRAWDPFFEDTFNNAREGDLNGNGAIDPQEWLNYWDETNASGTPSDAAALSTYQEDVALSQGILLFNGSPFYGPDNRPVGSGYDENAAGQYYLSPDGAKRASFADAAARHQMFYGRSHKSKYFCSTCHDVSNPILANLLLGGVGINETQADFGPGRTLWTENNPAYSYFHVERTFSEFMLSDYGQTGGAPGIGPFAPERFDTSYVNNYIAKCQDCHMPNVVGVACTKTGTPVRPTDSVEHPESGQPLHDLTGGNIWVSSVLASAVQGSPNYDAFNDQQLNQGAGVLTLDINQGLGINPEALLAGADRARQQLLMAATIDNLTYDVGTGAVSFRIQNQTGHKLISGFPEGRRMFINIRAYDALDNLIYEVNPYDSDAGTLKGLQFNYQPDPNGVLPLPASLGPDETYIDELVYEMHPSSIELTGESETFHFALATNRYKDNRIPPKGFRIAEAAARLTRPRWHGADAPNYFTAAEYAGGYDEVSVAIPSGAALVEVTLYYQTTSREYIEFLRDEINGNPDNCTLPSTPGVPGCDTANYIVQTDPFFTQLAAWGNTIWELWTHNMNVDGATPFMMAQATSGPATTTTTTTTQAPTTTTTTTTTTSTTQVTTTTTTTTTTQAPTTTTTTTTTTSTTPQPTTTTTTITQPTTTTTQAPTTTTTTTTTTSTTQIASTTTTSSTTVPSTTSTSSTTTTTSTTTTLCPPAPASGCKSGFERGLLRVSERVAGRERLIVKWRKGPAIEGTDFGNPLDIGGTAYTLCVYGQDGGLATGYSIARAGATCGLAPCWKPLGQLPGEPGHRGYRYRDREAAADGMLRMLLKAGDVSRSKALARGKNNAAKGQTALPTGVARALSGSASATVQLLGSDAPSCISVTLPTVIRNDDAEFKAKK